MALSQLKQAELVEVRKSGAKSLYRFKDRFKGDKLVLQLIDQACADLNEIAEDDAALKLALKKRKDHMRAYFDDLAGRFGKHYVPGRSWKALSEMLLKLLPPMRIADIGAGEGTLSLLLAQRAERVIAIDNSEKMVAYGRDVAAKAGVGNLEYRLGDLEELPLEDASIDLALFSQSLHHALHPRKALQEAHRVLRPGGRVMVLDLNRHGVEEARELYADLWLGFAPVELTELLRLAKFKAVEATVVHREDEPPHFETVLAIGEKAGLKAT
jgi:ArsR family transcriptional regulator